MPPLPKTLTEKLPRLLNGSQAWMLFPLLSLAAFWFGGEMALVAVAVALPPLWALATQLRPRTVLATVDRDALTGAVMRDGLIAWADHQIPLAEKINKEVAILALNIDDIDALEERFGRPMRDSVLEETAARLRAFLRDDDMVARIGTSFAIGLSNVRSPETENLLQLSRRMQSVFDEPFCEGPTRTYCSVSIGIASQCHVKGKGAVNLLTGAQRAAELAAQAGPGSVRVYSDGLSSSRSTERDQAREISNALENGEIFAWFQPQTTTDDGDVTGFEALARWDHPERGLIAPGSFLNDVERAGLSQRLAEVILKQSLTALNAWDAAGFDVPTISVNFSSEELRNPRLPDYVRWELDRHGIAPERLVVEVLESVVAESSEDVISRTLNQLSRIGCRIDLDDFGTGYTSFINIRRFNVGRIKIDRSLVSQLDNDEEQHRMVAALLAFSDKLGIKALAEGVETETEIEALRALHCEEIQGYVVARPMPLGETLLWLEETAPPDQDQQPRLRSVT
ncbi:MAG: bifunctional diguanylate cyclase/phosphodiesterase [Silicimonas sp.]|nr:bifunctional diguanylate cyclase/phosphodiesterase [Silicimonas sp.]